MATRNRQLAKLTAPTLPPLVLRPRLFKLLDRSRTGKVVWLTALPGSGKTTLVASYLRERRQRALWIQLDEGDSDPATFFHYLSLAAQSANPRARTALAHLTPEYLPQLAIFAQRFFDALYRRLAPHCTIVFDNYQTLHPDSPVHEITRIAATRLPRDLRMVVMSRAAVPAALSRLQADQRLELIEEPALRLTAPETKLLARLHSKGRARRGAGDAVGGLYSATGGWLAATVLMLKHGGTGSQADSAQGPMPPEVVFDYFATEVLNGVDPATRSVLFATALLPSTTVAMAQELTGDPGAGRVLAGLQRAGYFTERRDETTVRYQYHPLFRDFLLSRAAATLPASTLLETQRKAAALLARDGQFEAAVALYYAARTFDEAVALVLSQAPALLYQGRASVVIEWIGALPQAARDDVPWLGFWLGCASLAARPVDAQPLLERALASFEARGDVAGALLACAGVIDAIFYAWRDVPRLDRWSDRLLTLAAQAGDVLPPPIETAVTCAMLNALFWRRPGDPSCLAWMVKAEGLVATTPELDLRITSAAVVLVNAYMNLGDAGRAERLLRLVDERLASGSAAPFARLASFQMHAVIASYLGDTQRGLRATAQGLAFSVEHGLAFWNVPLLGARCLTELTQGDIAAAQRSVEQLKAQPSDGVMVFRTWILTMSSWLEQERGNLYEAHRAAEAALELALREGAFPEILARFSLAQTHHALGHSAEAASQLAHLAQIAQATHSPMAEIGWRFMAAQFAFARADAAAGLAELRAALRQAASIGYLDWQCRIGRDALGVLCTKAIEAGIERDYVRAFVRYRQLPPPAEAVHVEAWPWPVKVYTAGRFALVRGGRAVRFSGRTQKRPLDLLKVLIALGGRDVAQARVAELLWPDADGDAAVAAFNTNLKRLRALLGRADAVILAAGKLTVNSQVCWVDAWAFERGLRLSGGDLEARERALALYRGPFLGTEEQSWSISLRERLHSRFLRALGALGRDFENREQWTQAVELYQRGLDADDLAESFYQRLMICHERLGERDQALAAFRRCKKLLKSRLGAAPMARTQKHYERLVAS